MQVFLDMRKQEEKDQAKEVWSCVGSYLRSHIPFKYSYHPFPAIYNAQTGVYALEQIEVKTTITKPALSIQFDTILRR
jgi:hypothetical protein